MCPLVFRLPPTLASPVPLSGLEVLVDGRHIEHDTLPVGALRSDHLVDVLRGEQEEGRGFSVIRTGCGWLVFCFWLTPDLGGGGRDGCSLGFVI